MKSKLLLFFLLFLINNYLICQNYSSADPTYINNVKAGLSALEGEKFDSCMVYYRKAFKVQQTSVLSTLRMAACAYSGGYRYDYNQQLSKALDLNWGTSQMLFESYPEFKYLEGTSFDADLNESVKIRAKNEGINLELMNELAEINKLDQAQRREMGNFEWGTPQMDSLWKIQSYSDSLNTTRIIQIIEEYGYPGRSLVGPRQMGTAFLVIQHAELEVQQQYLPLLKEAAEAGELNYSSLALLIDRVNLREGKKQVYGSQVGRTEDGVYYISPLEDPENVDERRKKVGLGPINDYCKNWDFSFDLDEHIKIWESLEEEQKNK